MVALLTSVRNSPCFGGLRRTKTCHWQLIARPSTCFLVTICTTQKVTSRSLRREIRGLQNLDASCEGERVVTFCIVQKVTKKHVLGRAKSCRWQVFVRRRPPKQGELRTDVSKATMWGETKRRTGLPQATKKAACCRKKPRSGENSTRSVPSRQGHRRKAENCCGSNRKKAAGGRRRI